MNQRPPLPPFDLESAKLKVRLAEEHKEFEPATEVRVLLMSASKLQDAAMNQ
jgi:nuclear transport factor 2 (NTF2) superfamily protein